MKTPASWVIDAKVRHVVGVRSVFSAIHRYARLGLVAALVSAAGVACLSAGSSSSPRAEASPLGQNPNQGAATLPDDLGYAKRHGTAIATNDLARSSDGANSENATADTARDGQDAAKADNTVQLSPYNLSLPQAPEGASNLVRTFNVAAVRAVQRVYHEDGDDPSVLIALQDQLAQRPQLASLAPVWQGPLSAAMARATTLQALGPTLRSLRIAMANAYFDERLRIYRDVDGGSCETAFGSLPSQDDSLLDFVVTVEPIGTYPLAKFRSFCAESRKTALRERQLPGKPAPAPMVRLVRRLYAQAHLGGQVRSVSVVKFWQQDGQAKQSTLHAVVGVVRNDVRPGEEPCSIAEISVIKALNSSEPAVIGEVGVRQPILCDRL